MMIIMTVIYFGRVHQNKNMAFEIKHGIHPLGYIVSPVPLSISFLVWWGFCLSKKKRVHTQYYLKYEHKCLEWAWLCDIFLLTQLYANLLWIRIKISFTLYAFSSIHYNFMLLFFVAWLFCFNIHYIKLFRLVSSRDSLLHYAWFFFLLKSSQSPCILYTHNII